MVELRPLPLAWVVLAVLLVPSTTAGQMFPASAVLRGSVVDETGAPVAGAGVLVEVTGTGTRVSVTTGPDGRFVAAGLDAGTCTVEIKPGLISADPGREIQPGLISGLTLYPLSTITIRVVVNRGRSREPNLVAAAAVVPRPSRSASATLYDALHLSNLPLISRDAAGVLRDALGAGVGRAAHLAAYGDDAIDVTIDGVRAERDTPVARFDATASFIAMPSVHGARGSAPTAVHLVTRAGSNAVHGSVYSYYSSDRLKANTWFDLRDGKPKKRAVIAEPGFRLSGPVGVPGLWSLRNRAFFSIAYDESFERKNAGATRTMLTPSAAQGLFRYAVVPADRIEWRERNVLELAAANGQLSSFDPLVHGLLAAMQRAASSALREVPGDPNRLHYDYTFALRDRGRYPTVRLDFNLPANSRLTVSGTWARAVADPASSPEPFLPGLANGLERTRHNVWQARLRSSSVRKATNQFRISSTFNDVRLTPNRPWEIGAHQTDDPAYRLDMTSIGISNAPGTLTETSRRDVATTIEDAFTWSTDRHALALGGAFLQTDAHRTRRTLASSVAFDVLGGDPAAALFTAVNFPGASRAALNDAKALYSVLTGRVASVERSAQLDENTGRYVVLGPAAERVRLREFAAFAEDEWQLAPTVSVNYGVRYVLTLPIVPLNDTYSTPTIADVWGITGVSPAFRVGAMAGPGSGYLFRPGVLEGRVPAFGGLAKGTAAHATDSNNIGPTISAAWTPRPQSGWLSRLAGAGGDTVVRAGWTLGYGRHRLSDFADTYRPNGATFLDASLDAAKAGGALPLLLREPSRLGPPAVPERREYPMPVPSPQASVAMVDPLLRSPSASWLTFGVERALGKHTTLEARAALTCNNGEMLRYDYNEINSVENGFLEEFRLAQANLQANLAAGRGGTFAYFGPGTNTWPLPIFLAHFSGVPIASAGDPSRYTSAWFSSDTFLNPLAAFKPDPCCGWTSSAYKLLTGDEHRQNAVVAGLPRNFFVVNPDALGGAVIEGNGGPSGRRTVTVELRRRLADGLQFDAGYSWSDGWRTRIYSFRYPAGRVTTSGESGGAAHVLTGHWAYTVPFKKAVGGRREAGRIEHDGKAAGGGRGAGFGFALDVLRSAVSGLHFAGSARVESGMRLDFGNVRLVNMTADELRRLFRVRVVADATGKARVWMLPDDVIANTIKAFSTDATSLTGYGPLGPPTGRYLAPANTPACIEVVPGYGTCGARSVIVSGPHFVRVDLSIARRLRLGRGASLELRVDVFNALNRPAFAPVTGARSGGMAKTPDGYEVTTIANAPRSAQLVARVTF